MLDPRSLGIQSFFNDLHNAFATDVKRCVTQAGTSFHPRDVLKFMLRNRTKQAEFLEYLYDEGTNAWKGTNECNQWEHWLAMAKDITLATNAKAWNEILPDVCRAVYVHFYAVVIQPIVDAFDAVHKRNRTPADVNLEFMSATGIYPIQSLDATSTVLGFDIRCCQQATTMRARYSKP
jgi:hypothetical protein